MVVSVSVFVVVFSCFDFKRSSTTDWFPTLNMVSYSSSIYVILFIKIAVIATNELPGQVESGDVQQETREEKCNTTLKDSLCTKPACVHAASSILQNMDMSVDPCDDFYQFACKNFIENTRIPDEKSDVTIFSGISDRLEEQVHDVLESPVTEHDIRPFKLAKNFYNACMNKSLIDEIGTSYVKKLLTELGGWPVIEGDKWNESSFDWIESTYASSRLGLFNEYFFGFGVIVNYKNSSTRTLVISQANLALDRAYLIKGFQEKIVSEYYKYMVDTAVSFGANRERATVELKLSTEFEIALANISAEEQRDTNKLYNPMTISELETKYPSIPWLSFIRKQMVNETIEPNESVVIFVPAFIKKLEILVNNTPKRVLANYALGRIVKTTISYLPDSFYDRLSQFNKLLTGSTEKVPRWQECVRNTKDEISFAVDAMYVQKYFNKESKTRALNMVNKIRSQVYKTLENVEWMDNETRAAALAKANAMVAHVAYPDELLDDSKLTEYYENLDIETHNYHEAKLNVSRFKELYNLGLLHKYINKTDWKMNTLVTVVNAQYDRAKNALLLSAGVLQGTIFNKDFPNYLNYGGIGIFVGHEITHGFDDRGRQFDKDGNLVNWWHDETEKQFLEKANCFIQQYGNYTVKEINMNMNGIKTQGENIADNGGFKESYHAYMAWAQKNKQEPRLPGLEMFSPQQMFWISAASLWCTVSRPEILRNRVQTAHHSPGEFRVIGSVSNQEEFSKDFNCPVGSKMNPANKCRIW